MQSVRFHALDLISRGVPVFPLPPGSMIPAVSFTKAATTDPVEVDGYFRTELTRRGLGVATGYDGLFVLDVDSDKGGDESLKQLIRDNGSLPKTYTNRTPSGGYHFYFWARPDDDIRNSVGKIGDALDIRGKNGYVLGAGTSRDASDNKRAGVYQNISDAPIAEAPDWLLDRILAAAPPPKPKTTPAQTAVGATGSPLTLVQGNRNNTLFKEACALRGRGFDHAAIHSALTALNSSQAVDPLPASEIDTIVTQAMKYQPNAAVKPIAEQLGVTKARTNVVEHPAAAQPQPELHPDQLAEMPPALASISWDDLSQQDLPDPKPLIGDLITENSAVMVHGPAGVGKTQLCMSMALACASGTPLFPGWQSTDPAAVFYVDAEMSSRVMQRRMRFLVPLVGEPVADFDIHIPDMDPNAPVANLSSDEGRYAFEAALQNHHKLIVLDNLSSLQKDGDENTKEGWLPIQDLLIRLRAQGRTVILVHHDSKTGDQRGFSGHRDIMDVIIGLTFAEDDGLQTGVNMRFAWEKTRHADERNDTRPLSLILSSKGWAESAIDLVTQAATVMKMVFDTAPRTTESGYVKELMKHFRISRTQAYKLRRQYKESAQDVNGMGEALDDAATMIEKRGGTLASKIKLRDDV